MHSGAENPLLSPQASWLEVVTTISQGGLGAVNIINESKQLVGLITDGDLRRWVEKTSSTRLETLHANTIMTKAPIVVGPETLAYEALKLMENRPSQISVLPVVDEQHVCLGLIRLHDIVRCGL